MLDNTSHFAAVNRPHGGRIGKLVLQPDSSFFHLPTPILFPVVCLITGTTARGGGLWKYVLQADEVNGLLRRNIPVMSQVLHFLDFSSTNSKVLEKWRQLSLRRRYNTEVRPPLNYSAPIFLDSGGFQLLGKDGLDLSAYGLSIQDDNGPQTILDLQKDLGGNIVATLDYPLLPGLEKSEALERMQKSRDSAIRAALHLKEAKSSIQFLFVAVHGQDKASVSTYVQLVFEEFKKNGLADFPFGLAVGSLVPLRGSKKYRTIIEILQGVVESIPTDCRDTIPIHVFGITGNLMPILAYLGIDSFDSSTYAQEARGLGYIDHRTMRSRPILEMEEEDWTCGCRVCQQVTLAEIQDALTSSIRYRPLPNGHYKSKYYGDIALHNLELDFGVVERTRSAIEADSLEEYLLEHLDRFPQLRPSVDLIAQTDMSLQSHLNRTVHPVNTKDIEPDDEPRVSLKYTPDDFNILANEYPGPPSSARVLLIIPCSKGKPYSTGSSLKGLKKHWASLLVLFTK
jgi:tRNA-guanine family transglycosylase